MPLLHSASDKAKSANIATEINAGKPRAQAIAIGYSEQREARKKAGRGHPTLEEVKAARRKKKP